jgi:thiamine-monophosphate kinase
MRLNDGVAENRRLTRWAELLPRAPGQVGDVHETDAELVPLGDGRLLALTVDTVAEEIALGLYREPETAGRIAVTAALSDLAAVGADPIGLLLSVTLPAHDAESVQESVARGVAAAARDAGTWVLGGDTNEGATLCVSCSAAGLVPAGSALTRMGARPGERVFASGPLGLGAALAASALLGDASLLPESGFRPPCRLAEGRALRGVARAAMDTSDGLLATLDQLARLNEIAVRITRPAEELLHPAARAAAGRTGLSPLALLGVPHGEFELVFTVPDGRIRALAAAADRLGWAPLEIGVTEPGRGLFAGGLPLDGTRFRNLLSEARGDVHAYAAALREIAP